MADSVDKVEKFESRFIRQNLFVPMMASILPLKAPQAILQRDVGLSTVPPAEILQRPPM